MATSTTVRVEGLRELDAALGELPRSTGRAVLRRTLMKGAKLVQTAARQAVPVKTGRLRDSITIKTARDEDFAARARAAFVATGSAAGIKRNRQSGVSLDIGPAARFEKNRKSGKPTGLWAYAQIIEHGNAHQAAQPYMRPAWDSTKMMVLETIKISLGPEIEKSAQRLARKAAKG